MFYFLKCWIFCLWSGNFESFWALSDNFWGWDWVRKGFWAILIIFILPYVYFFLLFNCLTSRSHFEPFGVLLGSFGDWGAEFSGAHSCRLFDNRLFVVLSFGGSFWAFLYSIGLFLGCGLGSNQRSFCIGTNWSKMLLLSPTSNF